MTADEELLASSLRMLRDGGLDDAELDRRVNKFQGVLRRLRDDPAEAARIDALVMNAEIGQPDVEIIDGGRGDIYVSGGNVTITSRDPVEATDAGDRVDAALARMDRQLQKLASSQESLEETSARTRAQKGPRRIWETLLRPAFGGGILVAVLAIATITAAVHASASAMSIIGIILAVATAVTALLSVLVPWTSVRALNRQGDPYRALELLSGRNPVTTAYISDMLKASGESEIRAGEAQHAENPAPGKRAAAVRPRFSPRRRTYDGHQEGWATIRYALDSYGGTIRLCLILLGATVPFAAVLAAVALIYRAL